MELFRDDGHLTDAGLRAVIEETLDEMGRLEAAEHLGYCDACLVRYTALLTDDVLMEPETPLAEGVLTRIKRKAKRILWSRYGTVAAAACLAVAMWSAGSLALPRLRDSVKEPPTPPPAQSQQAEAPEVAAPTAPKEGLSDHIDNALTQATNGINGFFGRLLPAAGTAPTQSAEPDRTEKKEREDHVSLFNSKKDTKTKQDDSAPAEDDAKPDEGKAGQDDDSNPGQ